MIIVCWRQRAHFTRFIAHILTFRAYSIHRAAHRLLLRVKKCREIYDTHIVCNRLYLLNKLNTSRSHIICLFFLLHSVCLFLWARSEKCQAKKAFVRAHFSSLSTAVNDNLLIFANSKFKERCLNMAQFKRFFSSLFIGFFNYTKCYNAHNVSDFGCVCMKFTVADSIT